MPPPGHAASRRRGPWFCYFRGATRHGYTWATYVWWDSSRYRGHSTLLREDEAAASPRRAGARSIRLNPGA